MEEHRSKMLCIADGEAFGIDPIRLSEELSETVFERYLVHDPSVLGEDLLLLGRQLSEFKEDSKRLDLLAVDKTGELVLIELKVDDGAEFTELQAIGYAGAYSTTDPKDLAKTLCVALNSEPESSKWLPMPAGTFEATQGAVETLITEFLEEESFDAWTPSQKVRIKIVGPGFPRRVVASIRWLLEIHKLEIEAIEVKPFKQQDGSLSLVFERLLPVPGDEQLGLTRRRKAEEQQSENESKAKNKYVLPLLIENGDLVPGDAIVISKSAIYPKKLRNQWDPNNPLFQGIVDQTSTKKVKWRPDENHEWKLISPARMANYIEEFLTGEDVTPSAHAVGSLFTKGADGPFLDALAVEKGLWSY